MAGEASNACVAGYLLSNFYLGELLVLQADASQQALVEMAPRDASRPLAALWLFEPGLGPGSHNLRNLAYPDRLFSGQLRLTSEEEPYLIDWRVEQVDPVGEDRDPYWSIHPEEALARALDTGPSPPYPLQTTPWAGDAGQLWRLTPQSHCDEQTE